MGDRRRVGWVIDTASPVTDPLAAEMSPAVARPMRDALRRGRLVAEREAILAVIPPDPAVQIRAAELQRSRLQREREDLTAGEGRFRDHPVAHAIWELRQAETNVARLERSLRSRTSRAERRMWRSDLAGWRSTHVAATRAVETLSAPDLARIDGEEQGLGERLSGLWEQREIHHRWAADHPEASLRLDHLAADIATLDARLDNHRLADRAMAPERGRDVYGVGLDRGFGIDLGL